MEMSEITVSIIVPLFNGARFVHETLRTALDQSFTHLEVVVIDDGSTDDGPAVVQRIAAEDGRVTFVAKGHSGIAATRNEGLAHCDPSSRYVLFLDQDDILAPDLVQVLVSALAARPDAVGAYAIADYIDQHGEPWHEGQFADRMRHRRVVHGNDWVDLPPTADVLWQDLFWSNHLYPPSAVLLRRDIVSEVGGFDAAYEVADDWDLMIRVARRGPLLVHDEVRVGYRRHGFNASSASRRNVVETRAVWANTYFSPENSRADRTSLRRIWRVHQRQVAHEKSRQALEAVRRGTPVVGATGLLDSLAHLLIPRPLAAWRRQSRRSG